MYSEWRDAKYDRIRAAAAKAKEEALLQARRDSRRDRIMMVMFPTDIHTSTAMLSAGSADRWTRAIPTPT